MTGMVMGTMILSFPLTRPSTLAILEPSKATAVIEDANPISKLSMIHCRELRSIYLPARKAESKERLNSDSSRRQQRNIFFNQRCSRELVPPFRIWKDRITARYTIYEHVLSKDSGASSHPPATG